MRFEELASRVPGVLALRTVKGDDDVVVEAHVLVGPGWAAGEVARSIRSVALLSDIELPAERVHIVRLDDDEGVEVEPVAPSGPTEPVVSIDLVEATAAPADLPRSARPHLEEVSVRMADGIGVAVVELTLGSLRGRGSVDFVPTTPTERRAVAEATLRALTSLLPWEGVVAVDTAVVVPMPSIEVALVTVAAVTGDERTLVGSAAVTGTGVHEALARATLDATNRAAARQISMG